MIQWSCIDSFPGNHTAPDLTLPRPCPICGGDKKKEILAMRDFQFFTDDADRPKRVDVRQVQCLGCFALHLDPAYSPRGFEILFAEAGCSYGATEGRPMEQLEWLNRHNLLSKDRSLLDVGCYEGNFLALMPDTVNRIGVDIDAPAIERGRRKLADKGVVLIHGDFNRVHLPATPDTITMFHVLEHLPDPFATLMNLRNQSGPATRLVVEVPILENGFTNDINGFFSVQHMTHFSRASLKNVLKRSGWVIEEQLEQPGYNGCRVLCRPTAPGAEITPEAADGMTLGDYLAHYQNTVKAVSAKLSSLPRKGCVVIWGGGLHTEFLYHCTDLFKASGRNFVIVDKDLLKQGKTWRGIPIFAPDILRDINELETSLVISSYAHQEKIHREASDDWQWRGKVIELYDTIRIY